jgi:hypothetical protein
MVLVHLRYLQEQGHVIEDNGLYYLSPGTHPSRL